MDSITQLTLGAAVGEVVLGKKLGNRAMLWGAIAGTIPDLDVMSGWWMDDVQSLAFHRGITHSILFDIVASFGFAWLVHKLYKDGLYKRPFYKWLVGGLNIILLFLLLFGVNYLSYSASEVNIPMLILSVALLGVAAYRLWTSYLKKHNEIPDVPFMKWYWLFFWAFLTHALLDSCTPYGTQVFYPFSDYRVALNNIAIADPFYSIPFVLFVLASIFIKRDNKWRSRLNMAGIIVSSLYMVYTFSNKIRVDKIFENSLEKEKIEYSRYTSTPTIFNNFLWHCLAEGEDEYYTGMYSFFDSEPLVKDLVSIPKNHELVDQWQGDEALEVLKWFSKDYFAIMTLKDGSLQYNDLRYSTVTGSWDSPEDYIFNFKLQEKEGKLDVSTHRGSEDGNVREAFTNLLDRIKGI
jgi:inner membrane protein